MSVRILVVDDEILLERLINQLFRKKIQAKEYQFTFARNGIEAFEKLEQATPKINLILADINMPGMDGLTLIKKLNERNIEIRVVIVSAYGDLQNRRVAMNEGVFGFLSKPIDFQELEATINRALALSVEQ
ncbi:MAG: response regulator [Aphanothece sp. CMT-3BRIN-NPC111]|jgi:sigma-B regulation protein RsbU (phosphoserine phosphatase)|nr:response regulator [Aphanothece sp. CMT-3BRIN-NPC111]